MGKGTGSRCACWASPWVPGAVTAATAVRASHSCPETGAHQLRSHCQCWDGMVQSSRRCTRTRLLRGQHKTSRSSHLPGIRKDHQPSQRRLRHSEKGQEPHGLPWTCGQEGTSSCSTRLCAHSQPDLMGPPEFQCHLSTCFRSCYQLSPGGGELRVSWRDGAEPHHSHSIAEPLSGDMLCDRGTLLLQEQHRLQGLGCAVGDDPAAVQSAEAEAALQRASVSSLPQALSESPARTLPSGQTYSSSTGSPKAAAPRWALPDLNTGFQHHGKAAAVHNTLTRQASVHNLHPRAWSPAPALHPFFPRPSSTLWLSSALYSTSVCAVLPTAPRQGHRCAQTVARPWQLKHWSPHQASTEQEGRGPGKSLLNRKAQLSCGVVGLRHTLLIWR